MGPESQHGRSGLVNRSASLRYASDHADPTGTLERVVLPAPPIPPPPRLAVDGHRPRFRANGLHLGILDDPSLTNHIYFCPFSLLIFAHLPLQTYLDFNALLQSVDSWLR